MFCKLLFALKFPLVKKKNKFSNLISHKTLIIRSDAAI